MKEAIISRRSVRTFKQEPLTVQQIKEITTVIKKYRTIKGPFGNSFQFTFNLNDNEHTEGQKIGTYGMIRHAPAFIGGVCNKDIQSIIDFGFIFEHIILELTKLGYATCWLSGTFKRKDYRSKLDYDEVIPAISPVGIKAPKRSIIERTFRNQSQSTKRLESYKTYFDYNTGFPLGNLVSETIKEALALVTKAPSGYNKQPWRIYIEDQKAHFYLERNKGYSKNLRYDVQALDIGIALAHYKISLECSNETPTFKQCFVKQQAAQQYITTIEY